MAKQKKASKKKLTVKDLFESSAEYNPRTISERQLRSLGVSYDTFGDMSGVVLNRATNTLVSGHQRIKTLRGKKSRVVTEKHVDEFGTVEIGHIEVVGSKGTLSKIPFRIVDWSDTKAEKAANIAANAHGGDFDNNKLSKLLEELEPKEEFEIERLGLDPLTIRQLSPSATKTKAGKSSTEDDDADEDEDESEESFKQYDEDSFKLENCCPRCKFQW